MTYKIAKNPEYDSLEITFDEKPSAEVRDALKALRFRWHAVKKVWYGYADEEAVKAALDGGEAVVSAVPEKKAPASLPVVDRDELRKEYELVWDTKRMVDYCVNSTAVAVKLPAGEIITIKKEKIETQFCFGESGYDFDDAVRAADHARTSTEYFKAENMQEFRRMLTLCDCAITDKEVPDFSTRRYMVVYPRMYHRDSKECNLGYVRFERLCDVLDALGGSAFPESIPGSAVTIRGENGRVATAEEVQIVRDAYVMAAKAHEKKVDAYLKRYGLSKVHSWTYWRDA